MLNGMESKKSKEMEFNLPENGNSKDEALFSDDFCIALDSSNVPIYIIDPETFEMLYCNKALRSYFDYDPTELPCYKALMGQSKPCINCPAMKLYHIGDDTPVESYNPMGVWGLLHSAKLRWKGRELIQITCVDITKQKRFEQELSLSNKEYGAVVRRSVTGVMRYDIINDTAWVNVDQNLNRVEEYFVEEYSMVIFESNITKLIAPESMDTARSVFEDIRKGVPSKGYDIKVMLKDGAHWCHLDYELIQDGQGKPYRAVAFFYDNTEQREKEIAFQSWTARLNALMNDFTAYMEVNLTKDIIEVESRTGSWDKVTGGRRFSDFVRDMSEVGIYKDDIFEFQQFFNRERMMGQFFGGHKESTLEYRAMVEGSPQWYKAEVQMVIAPDSFDVKASIVYNNIDNEMRERKILTRKAERDAMTRLYNHAVAERLIKEVLKQNSKERCCFLVIDLDDLRIINSSLGHPEGDRALKAIAGAMRASFGTNDILGRIGGDEFVALLRNLPENADVNDIISGFVKRLDKQKIGPLNDRKVEVSVGGAVGIVGEDDFKTLYEHADLALYYTKAMGKNAFNLYTPELEKRDFSYQPCSAASLTNMDWYASSEFRKLLKAMSTFFPLVISANLTRNTYYMMEYTSYATQRAKDDGSFDDLIKDGGSAFHPDDQKSFMDSFSRESLLKAYHDGKRTVEHVGRQLGDDGIYRTVQTVAIFLEDEKTEDICEISFTHVIG